MSYILPVNTILLLGPTGVGKSPLGDAIAAGGLLGHSCHHLDFGSELRGAVSGTALSKAYTASEQAFILGVLEQGLLLENEHFALAEKIIRLFLDRVKFSQTDILIMNGIPRHTGQASDISRIAAIQAVINMDCSADDVMCRLKNNIGGDRTDRVDDDISLVRKKLEVFRTRTEPLVAHYKEYPGMRIYHVNITGSMLPEEAYQKISVLTTVDPPIAFIAEPPER